MAGHPATEVVTGYKETTDGISGRSKMVCSSKSLAIDVRFHQIGRKPLFRVQSSGADCVKCYGFLLRDVIVAGIKVLPWAGR